MQMLRDAAAKGSQMVHAPGTTVLPRNAPLGAAGAETIKDFEVGPSHLACAGLRCQLCVYKYVIPLNSALSSP